MSMFAVCVGLFNYQGAVFRGYPDSNSLKTSCRKIVVPCQYHKLVTKSEGSGGAVKTAQGGLKEGILSHSNEEEGLKSALYICHHAYKVIFSSQRHKLRDSLAFNNIKMLRTVTFLMAVGLLAALRLHDLSIAQRRASYQCNYLTWQVNCDNRGSFTSGVIKDWTDADVQAVKDGTKPASLFFQFKNFPSEQLQAKDIQQLKVYSKKDPAFLPKQLDFSGDEVTEKELQDFGLSSARAANIFGDSAKLHKFTVQPDHRLILLAFDLPNPKQSDYIPHQAIAIGEVPAVQSKLSRMTYLHKKFIEQTLRPSPLNYVRILHYSREQLAKRLLYAVDEYQKSSGQTYPKGATPIFGRVMFLKLEPGTEYLAAQIGEGDYKPVKVWYKDVPELSKCAEVNWDE